MKKILFSIAVAALTINPGHVVAQGDTEAGRIKSKTCAVCHGPNGISRYHKRPNLAGQKAEYLIKQMYDFREGKRDDYFMSAQSKLLTDKDIEDIAAYYASLPWRLNLKQ